MAFLGKVKSGFNCALKNFSALNTEDKLKTIAKETASLANKYSYADGQRYVKLGEDVNRVDALQHTLSAHIDSLFASIRNVEEIKELFQRVYGYSLELYKKQSKQQEAERYFSPIYRDMFRAPAYKKAYALFIEKQVTLFSWDPAKPLPEAAPTLSTFKKSLEENVLVLGDARSSEFRIAVSQVFRDVFSKIQDGCAGVTPAAKESACENQLKALQDRYVACLRNPVDIDRELSSDGDPVRKAVRYKEMITAMEDRLKMVISLSKKAYTPFLSYSNPEQLRIVQGFANPVRAALSFKPLPEQPSRLIQPPQPTSLSLVERALNRVERVQEQVWKLPFLSKYPWVSRYLKPSVLAAGLGWAAYDCVTGSKSIARSLAPIAVFALPVKKVAYFAIPNWRWTVPAAVTAASWLTGCGNFQVVAPVAGLAALALHSKAGGPLRTEVEKRITTYSTQTWKCVTDLTQRFVHNPVYPLATFRAIGLLRFGKECYLLQHPVMALSQLAIGYFRAEEQPNVAKKSLLATGGHLTSSVVVPYVAPPVAKVALSVGRGIVSTAWNFVKPQALTHEAATEGAKTVAGGIFSTAWKWASSHPKIVITAVLATAAYATYRAHAKKKI